MAAEIGKTLSESPRPKGRDFFLASGLRFIPALKCRVSDANEIIEMTENLADGLARVSQIVGQEGRMTEHVSIGPVKGAWATSVNSVNAFDLVQPLPLS